MSLFCFYEGRNIELSRVLPPDVKKCESGEEKVKGQFVTTFIHCE